MLIYRTVSSTTPSYSLLSIYPHYRLESCVTPRLSCRFLRLLQQLLYARVALERKSEHSSLLSHPQVSWSKEMSATRSQQVFLSLWSGMAALILSMAKVAAFPTIKPPVFTSILVDGPTRLLTRRLHKEGSSSKPNSLTLG